MNDVLEIKDSETIIALAKALSSETRFGILKLLIDKELSISKIAKEMNQTEANTSAQVKMLEKNGLMENRYEPGAHGVRNVCKTKIRKIVLEI